LAKVTLVRFGFFFATQNVNQQRKYFLEFGAISELEVQADKGQAFITFDDHDSVDRAVSKKHTVSTIIFVSVEMGFDGLLPHQKIFLVTGDEL